MGSITNTAETEMLDHVLNQLNYASPATVYLCLCTADPTDAATGASMNEVANANAYARTAISFGAAAARVITQDAIVTFPQASGGGWGTVTHWAIATSGTYGAGDCLAHGAFTASKTINDGDTPSVASGEINVTYSAGEISNYLANELLDHLFNAAAFAATVDTYIALCTVVVTDGMTGSTITEPSGGAYARQLVQENTGAAPDWDLAVSGDPSFVDNSDAITFPTATASWGTIVAVAICDAVTAGNLLFYDNAMTDKAVGNGDTAEFATGDLDVQAS